ncbi:MAG: ABC transporter substrate-binding protein [Candidatus Hydrogenedentota bacterium]
MRRVLIGVCILIIFIFLIIWRLQYKPAPTFSKPDVPQRIVSLSNPATEILFLLGVGNKVVGVSSSCQYPLEAVSKTAVGRPFGSINLELILGLKPDIVICDSSNSKIFKDHGIPVFVVSTCTLDYVIRLVKDLGKLVDKEAEAEEIAGLIEKDRDFICSKVEKLSKKPLVYFEAGSLGRTRARGSLTHDLITYAGGINIAANEPVSFPVLSNEYIISKNPDVIIVEEYGVSVSELRSRSGWQNINAIKNNRVYKSPVYFTNYSPRCIEGLKQFAQWFHPGLFQNEK